jgi:hypothetical protein
MNTSPKGGGCDDTNIAAEKAQFANFIFLVSRNTKATGWHVDGTAK